jgi:mannan endo-1,4-beta-mannosidase
VIRLVKRNLKNAIDAAKVVALSSLSAAAAIILLGSNKGQARPLAPAEASPVNPDATPEARELLKQIGGITGRFTLTGQQNFIEDLSRCSDRVCEVTGKYPAIFGQDFGFSRGNEENAFAGRPAMIEELERQFRKGAVIALTWHAASPTDDEPVTYEKSVQGRLTDAEWNELLTVGTDLYNRWVEQVDTIAAYLRRLQALSVPVLFRPYHEMNAKWFWWGGRPGRRGSSALYKQMYERYVNVHGLNNLIWVWNVNSPSKYAGPIDSYYPGAQFVDIATMDNYGRFKRTYYEDMLALAGNKPIALAEVGAIPTVDVLAKQTRWAYFMIWRGFAEERNSLAELQAVFHAPNVLNRGDEPFSTVPPRV